MVVTKGRQSLSFRKQGAWLRLAVKFRANLTGVTQRSSKWLGMRDVCRVLGVLLDSRIQ